MSRVYVTIPAPPRMFVLEPYWVPRNPVPRYRKSLVVALRVHADGTIEPLPLVCSSPVMTSNGEVIADGQVFSDDIDWLGHLMDEAKLNAA